MSSAAMDDRSGRVAAAVPITSRSPFAEVTDAIAAIARGEIVVVVDDEDRENEGDLIFAAEHATPETMAFLIRHTSGVVCVAMEAGRCDALRLPLMVPDESNDEAQHTAFTVTVDVRAGTTTGISAADRARTVRAIVDPSTVPDDLVRPGHVFPLRARAGGVLKRAGHTEAAVDLATLAGLSPVGVLSEVVRADGEMARLPDLIQFCNEHDLLLVSIAQLVRHRREHEQLVRRVSSAGIPTPWGDFTAVAYSAVLDDVEHIAFVYGEPCGEPNVLVRVHSECLTGDIFGSQRCDCGAQLRQAMRLISEAGQGVLVYLRGHEGRGIGLGHKLRAYGLQDQGLDTVAANEALGLPVDSREYGIGAHILADLGVTTIRLLSNNPTKYGGLAGFGIDVVERVPLATNVTPQNVRYLTAKRERMGHAMGDFAARALADSAGRNLSPWWTSS
jgi:3,4-dihydroxy 2-butanone 4-phosphate synthase/GTP cyclohydrolase II